jgi:hypothetical protein
MIETRDWRWARKKWISLLERKTSRSLVDWKKLIREKGFETEAALKSWLTGEGVTGYARSVLLMETFGYPVFFDSTGDRLIDAQFEKAPQAKDLYSKLLLYVSGLGKYRIEARKTYISLVAQERTFARVKVEKSGAIVVGLRLPSGFHPDGLVRSHMHSSMAFQIVLRDIKALNANARRTIKISYEAN